jgi:hypothetical protein
MKKYRWNRYSQSSDSFIPHSAFSIILPSTPASRTAAKKQACGPEVRALRGKSIGGKGIPAGDPIGFPQGEAGLSGFAKFGIRNVEFGIICFPFCHSAFRNLHSAFWLPARSKK